MGNLKTRKRDQHKSKWSLVRCSGASDKPRRADVCRCSRFGTEEDRVQRGGGEGSGNVQRPAGDPDQDRGLGARTPQEGGAGALSKAEAGGVHPRPCQSPGSGPSHWSGARVLAQSVGPRRSLCAYSGPRLHTFFRRVWVCC